MPAWRQPQATPPLLVLRSRVARPPLSISQRTGYDLLIDLLFAANGQTYESVQPHVREIEIEGTPVRVLNIDGLIKTKTDYREKDVLDKQVLMRIKQSLDGK